MLKLIVYLVLGFYSTYLEVVQLVSKFRKFKIIPVSKSTTLLKQETLPEIPTTERVIKSTRKLYWINLCLAANVECADEVWLKLIYSKKF